MYYRNNKKKIKFHKMYFPILAAIWIDGHAFVIHIVYLQEMCEPCYEENPLEKVTRKLPRKGNEENTIFFFFS